MAITKSPRKAVIRKFQKRVATIRKTIQRKHDVVPRPKFPKLLEDTWPDYISRA
jgi:hypothetical protein